jgi:cytosine/adenosine deaminase-related metal-dependent hydrolase
MDGPPIENGAVAISEDRIIDVGRFADVEKHSPGEVLDLGEYALLPGLINAHCHLDYTCLRGKIPRPDSFTKWIGAINAEKAKLAADDYIKSINAGFAEARSYGTTTIANLVAFPELVAKIDEPIRTWWFAELIDVREPNRASEIVDRAVGSLKAAKNWGLAPHAPFTASANLFRRCEEVARAESISLTTHLAESAEEMSMFDRASGPLYEFMKEIGRDMDDCGGTTPLSVFLKLPGVGGRALPHNDLGWIVAHVNDLTETDLSLLKASENRFHLVHCPRSHEYFQHSTFQYKKLCNLGFNICLGTDSLASNHDLSLFREMRAFRKSHSGVFPEDIVAMATVNPAKALGKPHVLGRIRANYFADMVAIPFEDSRKSLYEALSSYDGVIGWLMIGGKATKL